MMNIVRCKAVGPLMCRRPERPVAIRAVSRATVAEPSQAPHGHKLNRAQDTTSTQEAARARKRKRAARRRAAAKKRSRYPKQAHTVQQLCTSTAEYSFKFGSHSDVNLKGRTLGLGQQPPVQLSHEDSPTATCFRSPHLHIWPRLKHAIDEVSMLECVRKYEACIDECLFSLQADSSAVVHRLSAADVSNGTIELADGHCILLDEHFSGMFKNVTFKGGALVLRGTDSCRLVNCSFELCTLVATEGVQFPYGYALPSQVSLSNVKFLCSIREGAGICIYSNHSDVTAYKCNIVGGWQGVAVHNMSTLYFEESSCKNAALIGIESYCSAVTLQLSSVAWPGSNSLIDGSGQADENLNGFNALEEDIIRQILAEASGVRDSYATDESEHVGGMLFGALLVHAQAKAYMQVFTSRISGYRGVHVRNAEAHIRDSTVSGHEESLLVYRGSFCSLYDSGVSGGTGDCTVRVSGRDSLLHARGCRACSEAVLLEKGARAHLCNFFYDPLLDSSSEEQEGYGASPGDEDSEKEVVVVSSGIETLFCWESEWYGMGEFRRGEAEDSFLYD